MYKNVKGKTSHNLMVGGEEMLAGSPIALGAYNSITERSGSPESFELKRGCL